MAEQKECLRYDFVTGLGSATFSPSSSRPQLWKRTEQSLGTGRKVVVLSRWIFTAGLEVKRIGGRFGSLLIIGGSLDIFGGAGIHLPLTSCAALAFPSACWPRALQLRQG